MLRIDLARWGLTPELLTLLIIQSPCPRTRERLLCIRDIAQGSCASRLVASTGRHLGTLLQWVHAFEHGGPQALVYRHSGGRRSQRSEFQSLVAEAVQQAQAQAAVSKKRRSCC